MDLAPIAYSDLAKRNGVFAPSRASRIFFRRPPQFVDNPDHVAGFEDMHEARVEYPPVFIASAVEAMVVGYRTVVTSDGKAFNDDSIPEVRFREFLDRLVNVRDAFMNEDTGLRREPGSDLLTLIKADSSPSRLKGPIALLSSFEPSNYGSFLFRVVPKLIALRRWPTEDMRFLFYSLGENSLRLLELLGVNRSSVIYHNPHIRYEIDNLIVPSQRNNQAYLDAESVSLYASLRERFGFAKSESGKAIYVSRLRFNEQAAVSRHMENEAELIARLSALGVEIVFPEKLDITEQISTFSRARLVIGPSGSGMFNVVFCSPGTSILDIESEPWWLHAHMCLFTSLGLNYGFIIGKPCENDTRPVHKRWRANIEAICRRAEIVMQHSDFTA